MSVLFPQNPEECVPFTVGQGDSNEGSRVGGAAPAGVRPLSEDFTYFATFRIQDDPAEEISIFLKLKDDVVTAESGTLFDDLIDVVSHPPSSRGPVDGIASKLSAHPILIQPSRGDWMVDDSGEQLIESQHKLGGRPFLINNETDLENGLAELQHNGFRQIVQFDFPSGGGDALVSGPWPFITGMFHLLGRQDGGRWEWRWFWEF